MQKIDQNFLDQVERTRAILDTVVDGIITISAQGIIETVNPAALGIFGYTEDELIGQNVKVLMPEPYKKEHDGYLAHHIQTGEKKVIGIGREVEGKRKNGQVFPMELSVGEMEVSGVKMFTGIVRDITERKFVESRQQEVEARTKAIIETVVDGIITINMQGIIETVNPATLRIFGYQDHEMIGQNVKMLMPNPYHDEHDGYLKHFADTGERKVIGIGRDVQGQRKDGSVFSLELAVSEMSVNGKRMFTGIVRDVTERKQAEKTKEEFISTVSHELRTPLTSIRGSVGLLMGGVAGEFSDKAKQLLSIAQNNTERLLMLINDILDLSKIEAGKMDFNFQEMDVQALLDHAIEANAGYGAEKEVHFVVENSVQGAAVHGDEGRLMQVMSNLMSNAAKFAPKGDSVKISAVRHHNQIRISVTDHGSGIPKAFQGTIFDKFTQADSSDTRQVGGTGLGLNITKAIVEKHSGRISFVTEEGVGTTFYFDIPEIKSHTLDTENETVLRPGVKKILVCDDEPDIASLIRLMLAQSGFEADIALTAEEAENLLRTQGPYSAMTLDIQLPNKDGATLYKELRSSKVIENLAVVFVSVQAERVCTTDPDIKDNPPPWVTKPIDENNLIDAIELAIEEKQGQQLVHILHVEDDADIRQLMVLLMDESFVITQAGSVKEAEMQLNDLQGNRFDLVLLDIGLPDGSGLDLLETISELTYPPEVLVFSADDIQVNEISHIKDSLVKSKTTNDQLVAKIKSVVANRKGR